MVRCCSQPRCTAQRCRLLIEYQAVQLLAVERGEGARRKDRPRLLEQRARGDEGRAGVVRVRAGFGVARHGCCDAREVGARARAAWGDVCSSPA